MVKKELAKKTVDQILKSYDFPHKFYVKYAVACARLCIAKVGKPSPEALHALDLADRFSLGDEQISQEELRAAADAAYAANTVAAAYAAYTAAPYAAAHAAAYSSSSAAHAASSEVVRRLLLDLIDKEFSELEKLLL